MTESGDTAGRGPHGDWRRLLPFAGFVLCAVLLLRFVGGHHAPPVRCGVDRVPDADTVVMLGASWCGYCRRARAFFDAKGIDYCEYDIEDGGEGTARYERAGLHVVPVIYIGDQVLVGFSREDVAQTLAARELLPLEDL